MTPDACEYCGRKEQSLRAQPCIDRHMIHAEHHACERCYPIFLRGPVGCRYLVCPEDLSEAQKAMIALARGE